MRRLRQRQQLLYGWTSGRHGAPTLLFCLPSAPAWAGKPRDVTLYPTHLAWIAGDNEYPEVSDKILARGECRESPGNHGCTSSQGLIASRPRSSLAPADEATCSCSYSSRSPPGPWS